MKKTEQTTQESAQNGFLQFYNAFKRAVGIVVTVLYRLRKVVMAAPVVYYALRLAAYNAVNLPQSVGLNLQSTGEFAMHISRYAAVVGPLALTGGCLAMMFLSRKAMYAWAISIFSLALPLLILFSNIYPA